MNVEHLYRPFFERYNTQLTKKKLVILYGMMKTDGYIDGETLFLLLREKYPISYSSVYNTLKQLTYMKLVTARTDSEGRKREFRMKKKLVLHKDKQYAKNDEMLDFIAIPYAHGHDGAGRPL
ncbi:transcriptional repressor [Sphingobacterium sp. JB170]|uniref:transcriptional repressor n=1 Tax=Sphingobacterium sp. JB170 TaxID=1434842 RepID=UPI00097E98E2|nr:transcriptional repressor [Sphingobacterium sp. JB170]SJN22690.1 hypothetical protein FM107_03470 [Sphingobacterium sp. JB170]